MSPVTWILIGQALAGVPFSSQVMLPPLAIVRFPVTLKTPSTVPSEASATANVVGTLIVTSAAFFLMVTKPAAFLVWVLAPGFGACPSFRARLAAVARAKTLRIAFGSEPGAAETRETAAAATRTARPTLFCILENRTPTPSDIRHPHTER